MPPEPVGFRWYLHSSLPVSWLAKDVIPAIRYLRRTERMPVVNVRRGQQLQLRPRVLFLGLSWAVGAGLRKDYMTHRPNIERVIAQVATWRGRRVKLRTAERPRIMPGSSAAPRR